VIQNVGYSSDINKIAHILTMEKVQGVEFNKLLLCNSNTIRCKPQSVVNETQNSGKNHVTQEVKESSVFGFGEGG
jgi:hypothetical protein